LSVDSGVIISFLNKDYELQSWNEQGEITRIEGILTIAFLVVSPCSHKDKQLYLIIKIHYLVNMPLKDKDKIIAYSVDFEQYDKWVKEVPKLEQRIKELESENKILNGKIEELTKKVEDLKKFEVENQTLKEKLGIVESKWQIERDLAWRNNPITDKFEQYGFPIEFQEIYVENFIFTDEEKNMCRFKLQGKKIWKEYDMPFSLYNFLKENSPVTQSLKEFVNNNLGWNDITKKLNDESNQKKEDIIIKIDNFNDMKKYMESQGEYHYNYRNLELVHKFLIENKDQPFSRTYFTGKCEISPRTVSKYLKMLEKCKLIIKLQDRGKYKVNIK